MAAGAAAAAEAAEALREKDKKINELIEDLGNKELLLSEAQGQLAAVRAAGWRPAACRLHACSAACSAGCAERKSARCSLRRRGMCLNLRQLESCKARCSQCWLMPARCPSPTRHALPPRPSQTANQRKELEELRELKEDVERREKAQAEVISQQVGPAVAVAGFLGVGRPGGLAARGALPALPVCRCMPRHPRNDGTWCAPQRCVPRCRWITPAESALPLCARALAGQASG